MEGVVEKGTGKAAQIPGYTIAGKTGTATKLVNGRYSHDDYNASFVGFVPSQDPALTIIASRNPDVFKPHALHAAGEPHGEYRLNPLYAAEQEVDRTALRLRFPNDEYAQEYAACRQYLPDEIVVSAAALERLAGGRLTPELADLARRRVVLDLPKNYY